jgi:endonuclease/exonuclease/phosphatase family metal-dependent hydrolase
MSKSSPESLRVLHWNVWHGSDPEAIGELIVASQADVALLQEVPSDAPGYGRGNMQQYLRDNLSDYGFGDHRVADTHTLVPKFGERAGMINVEDGIAIFSKIPLIGHTVIELSNGGWDLEHEEEHRSTMYVGSDLILPGTDERWKVGTTHRSIFWSGHNFRRKESEVMSEILEDHRERSVVSGDFNARKNTVPVQMMPDHLRRIEGDFDTRTVSFSFRGKVLQIMGKEIGMRVDYMFVSEDVEVVNTEIRERGPSDHIQFIADLKAAA